MLRRLAVTVLVPAVLLWLARYALLPGVDTDAVSNVIEHGGSSASLEVLALGMTPILTAFWIVEVVAFLVPRWSRLRHAGPESRAKLNVAAIATMLVLAAVQGFGVAMTMKSVGETTDVWAVTTSGFSVPLVTVSLVGGVCVLFVAAQMITRYGLANGFIVLTGAELLRSVVPAIARRGAQLANAAKGDILGSTSAVRELAPFIVALLAVALATWAILRDAGDAPPVASHNQGANPYRDARALVVRPRIPLPVGSLQATYFAGALLEVPRALEPFVPSLHGVVNLLNGDVYTPIYLGLLLVTVIAFGRLMNRPVEMAQLAARLGAEGTADMAREARSGFWRALVPSLLFFGLLTLASRFIGTSVGGRNIVFLVAIAIDLARALRLEWTAPSLVTVWEERRASAVPVLRAVLAAEGIQVQVRGAAVQSLWQIFAPYAPVELRVAAADKERAIETLRHLLLGEAKPEGGREAASPAPSSSDPWPVGTRSGVLVACALAIGSTHLGGLWPAGTPKSGIRLVYEVDFAGAGTAEARAEVLRRTGQTLRKRLSEMGLRQLRVAIQGEQLVVDVPAMDSAALDEVKDVLDRPGDLAFSMVDEVVSDALFAGVHEDHLPPGEGIGIYQAGAPDGLDPGGRKKSVTSAYARISCQPNAFPKESPVECLHRFQAWTSTLPLQHDRRVGFEATTEPVPDTEPMQFKQVGWTTLVLDATPSLTGASIVDASVGQDRDNYQTYFVSMTLSPAGGAIFEDVTAKNVNRRFAIELDGIVDSAPIIRSRISGGRAQISMGAGDPAKQLHDAKQLEIVLRAGALPAHIQLREEAQFGGR